MNLTHLKIGERAQIKENVFWLAEKGLYMGLEFELFQRNGDSCILRLAGGKIAVRMDLRRIQCDKSC